MSCRITVKLRPEALDRRMHDGESAKLDGDDLDEIDRLGHVAAAAELENWGLVLPSLEVNEFFAQPSDFVNLCVNQYA